MVCSLRRNVEPVCDLSRCEPLRCEAQHLDLATGKPAWVLRSTGRGGDRLAVAGRREYGIGRVVIEHAL